MGLYINIGNSPFRDARNGEYVDKSGLIGVVNKTLCTELRFSCVTRARRFGKSMAAKMLCAYYDYSCDSRELFSDLAIARDPSFEKHLNKYPVVYIDMSSFINRINVPSIVSDIEQDIKHDIQKAFRDVEVEERDDLMDVMGRIAEQTGQQFVLIIDEWDAICRDAAPSTMDAYVSWLRRMFKSIDASRVFAAVYMTGILPIKKYNTQSALNNFTEYSMIEPRRMAPFFGFTEKEVKELAQRYDMDFAELQKWYDGYQIGSELSMFNPNSVMQAVMRRRCRDYWAKTGAYDAVATYIRMNFEGLKDDIIRMLAGGRVKVRTSRFNNDIREVRSRDDVLTLLIHLGYLSFDWNRDECYIPNREVADEMVNAVEENRWDYVVRSLLASEQLLDALLRGDADAVARGVEAAHDESTSVLSYNDEIACHTPTFRLENSMACVLSLAFYYARNDYVMHREYATGKGFADLVLIPRKNVTKPAVIIELKYDHTVGTALDQIRHRHYPQKVAEYTGDMLLVGISYDRQTKQHACQIEQVTIG